MSKTIEQRDAEYRAAQDDPVLGPILSALHDQDARTYNGQAGDIVEAAKKLADEIEPIIRKAERHRLADLLDNHLTTFVGFAKDQPSMVRLVAYTLRLDHEAPGRTTEGAE